MKALLELELRVAWRTVTGVGILVILAAVMISLVILPTILHGREAVGPLLAPAILFAAVPWIVLSANVLDTVDGLAAARPVSRGRLLLSHLSLTGGLFLLAGLAGAAIVRITVEGGDDWAFLPLPLALTATGLPLLLQQAQRRRSWVLIAGAWGLFLGFARWRRLFLPELGDLTAPAAFSVRGELAPLLIQAFLVLALGSWVFLRGRGLPGTGAGAGGARGMEVGKHSGGAIPMGRSPAASLLRTAYGSWNLPLLMVYALWMLFYLRKPEHDAFVLGLSTMMMATSMSLPLARWRYWIHLPMARSRAFRILLIPPAVAMLVIAGIHAVVVEGKDRTRSFPVAELHEDGSFSVDWVHHQTRELELKDPAAVTGNAVSVMESRWGIHADGTRVEGAVLAGWPAGGIAGRRFQEDWHQVSDAYERVRLLYEDEIRRVLRVRAYADAFAVLLLSGILCRVVCHPWKRQWYRALAFLPFGAAMMLIALPSGDLSGGWGPVLRDGYYGVFQATPLLCSVAGAAAMLALLRSSSRAFARIEWDMLPADSKGATAP